MAGEAPPSPRVPAVLPPVNPPGTAQPASAPAVLPPRPYHMSMLVVCVVIPSSSSGARYLRREGAGLQEAPPLPPAGLAPCHPEAAQLGAPHPALTTA